MFASVPREGAKVRSYGHLVECNGPRQWRLLHDAELSLRRIDPKLAALAGVANNHSIAVQSSIGGKHPSACRRHWHRTPRGDRLASASRSLNDDRQRELLSCAYGPGA